MNSKGSFISRIRILRARAWNKLVSPSRLSTSFLDPANLARNHRHPKVKPLHSWRLKSLLSKRRGASATTAASGDTGRLIIRLRRRKRRMPHKTWRTCWHMPQIRSPLWV
ncbi:hypothetical protein KSP39_PZI022781 [Platanthera zijinensis]|uniref:Uncharacterized protein n=1 Tax=Platanthera zijinensis TaxID=2320716 RepID=A0AAP0FU60_9ASPA